MSINPSMIFTPNNFFDGKWFYVRTVIRTSEESSSAVGHQPYEPATLVEFHKTSDALKIGGCQWRGFERRG